MSPEEKADLELARWEAEAALPPGWRLSKADLESFRLPKGRVVTYSAAAEGPDGAASLAVAVTEAAAWRHLARRLRGELAESEGWAPPLPPR